MRTGAGAAAADAARVMDGLRRLVRALHVASRASERELGVSAAQLFVLRQLSVAPGGSLNDLAVSTRTAQSSVSEVVGRLVNRGLVTRQPSSADRRRAELTLTPEGQALLARAPETIQERLLAALARIDDRERRALADGLDAWLASAGLGDVPATFFFEPT